ncbi:MAG TPA: hypothetical protein VIY48_19730 [Candidatus Paceibacterota bacterium]
MSRALLISFMAMAMLLLFSAAFAQGYDDCKQACAADRDTRNMACPSPYDDPSAGAERRQCIEKNQAAYKECIKQCPAPPPASSGDQLAPPAMGY